MSQTLEQVIGAANLTGIIQATTTGFRCSSAGILCVSKDCNGNQVNIHELRGRDARRELAAYGSPKPAARSQDVATVPVTLLHSIESICMTHRCW